MIINEHLRFLFIHIQKTAGTSINNILMTQPNSKLLFNNHTLLRHVDLTKEQDSYFKFAFVRNPWDRLYSWYNMSIQKGPVNKFHAYTLMNSCSFSDFLECQEVIEDDLDAADKTIPYYKSISFNQLDYLTDMHGKLNIDYIGRFESLEEDFNLIAHRLGMSGVKLPHLNKFPHDNYRLFYSDSDIEKVYRLYQKDIDYFNYDF